ncbi:UDP-N-acetylmuramoyl-tripeptide--D-alanyl-D-alanine ligase [Staphylospora marina]|uniref:UDP-N-acetylmuramoyl-tripeptide--D-alanyl-D- alanine ligase n=1 Tax=Staphylospora marina TaxID=2490858 RepID=UPI000F5C28A3|nr:UDP-N-acetylmuramoyl-tripeptide--D-alanyl-D-alanine ligase [Staphylospora marina]
MIRRTCTWIAHATGGRLHGTAADRTLLVKGVSTDTRNLWENCLFVPLSGERFDGHAFLNQAVEGGAAAALWQEDRPLPDADIPLILVKDPLTALQRLASAWRLELGIPVVAVTGSNGKTTTKDLIAAVLSVRYRVHKTSGNFNNHIGVPLTLLSMPEDTEIAVVEMGMNHAGEISVLSKMASPDAAVITNIGESHIEFLGSREGIAKAKLEVREGLSSNAPIVFDGDEPLLERLLEGETRPLIRVGWAGRSEESPVEPEMKGFEGFEFRSLRTGHRFRLPLLGRHNLKNALMAVEIGRHFGMKDEEISRGLESVKLTGMRLEPVRARNGLTIVNDAYNASPTSVKAALDLLAELEPGKEKWALLGDILEIGKDEEAYHRELAGYAIRRGVIRLYTYGRRGKWIHEEALALNRDPERVIRHFDTHEEAVRVLGEEGSSKALLLVKASRAARLDLVVHNLTEGA